MARWTRRAALAILAASSTACFNYRPVSVAELGAGQTVRAYLSDEQARELADAVTLQGRQVIGTVAQSAGDRIFLDIRIASMDAGGVSRTLNQRVALASEGVVQLERRELNGWKTALVVGGAAAVVGGLVAWHLSEQDNSPVQNPKDPPEALRIPLVSIGIPLPGAR